MVEGWFKMEGQLAGVRLALWSVVEAVRLSPDSQRLQRLATGETRELSERGSGEPARAFRRRDGSGGYDRVTTTRRRT